jgi:hypothetical protein
VIKTAHIFNRRTAYAEASSGNYKAPLSFVRLLANRYLMRPANEDFQMLTGSLSAFFTRRRGVFIIITALLFTMAEQPPASADPASRPNGVSAASSSSDATDFSAARRRRHYRRGGNAAGLAVMGLAIGAIGAIAAQQQRRDYYDNGYGYAPGYYGGGPYYGRGYYRQW